MSRSKKGGKSAGFDYWGKRALSGDCGHGSEVKRITHGLERARGKQALLKEPTEPEYDPQEYCPPCALEPLTGAEHKYCEACGDCVLCNPACFCKLMADDARRESES